MIHGYAAYKKTLASSPYYHSILAIQRQSSCPKLQRPRLSKGVAMRVERRVYYDAANSKRGSQAPGTYQAATFADLGLEDGDGRQTG